MRNNPVGDDWAYATMVRHLLDTGHYKVHDFTAANMPFQIYWGAIFAKFGPLHSLLRISTLVLWLAGLIGFFGLAQEHRFRSNEAAVLALALLSSPFLMRLCFSFYSDAPYLACVLLALWLYTRALRLSSPAVMLLASVPAAAAILTRQFGIVLPAAIVLMWLIQAERLRRWKLFIPAIVLPVFASLVQWRAMAAGQGADLRFQAYQQTAFLHHPLAIVTGSPFRLLMILQYLGLCTVPLLVLVLYSLLFATPDQPGLAGVYQKRRFPAAIIGAVALGSWLFVYFRGQAGLLALHLQTLDHMSRPAVASLVAAAITTALLVLFPLVARYRKALWRQTPYPERLLDVYALIAAIVCLAYWQFADRYVLPLLPYAILITARLTARLIERHLTMLLAVFLIVGAMSALWTRTVLSFFATEWSVSEQLLASGVPSSDVAGCWYWVFFHSFVEIEPAVSTASAPQVENVMQEWADRRERNALYLVNGNASEPGRVLVGTVQSDVIPFLSRRVYIWRKGPL